MDRSESNEEYLDFHSLADSLGFYGFPDVYTKEVLTSYWLTRVTDTDTDVGVRAIYLNGYLVGTVKQTGRKSDSVYYWLSEEAVKDVVSYLATLIVEKSGGNVYLIDPESDIPDTYKAGNYAYAETLKNAWYGDEWVTIVGFESYTGETVTVEFSDGERTDISIRELDFPLLLEK